MEDAKRIEELEAQVHELSAVVQRLAAGSMPPDDPPAGARPAHARPDMLQRVEQALHVDKAEDLETHIGAVWLSRIAVVALMTFVALGARETFSSHLIGPLEKVLIGYGIAVGFIAYGIYFRRAQDLFAQALLGCGLAILYFCTYAIFFIDEMRMLNDARLAYPLLVASLLFLAGVAHWQRSQTVAGIGLFLAYYTVVVSCTQHPTEETLTQALLTCAVLAVVTFFFHFAHRWLLFTWAALVATHMTYLFFFLRQPPAMELPQTTYFWISNGFLTLFYVLFSLTCIADAWKTGEYRRGVAPMAGVNSFVYFTLTWVAIRLNYPAYEWMFRSGFALLLLAFALAAAMAGPRKNYLYQIFIAKTVIMITLAMQAYFSGEKLLVAMAIECLGLAFSYRRAGLVTFKVLGLLLMGATFLGCLAAIQMPGSIALWDREVPARWFSAVGVAASFLTVAWFYERFVRRLRPQDRTEKGHWLFADSFLDWNSASMAVVHAACAAILLLTITILEFGEDARLPFLLAAEGAVLAAAGLVVRVPQIEIGAVLLFVAAHVCFHVFLWMPLPGFELQAHYAVYTLLLALLTYGGAHAWERYLLRYHAGGRALEHHIIAAVPYLMATLLLTTLLARQLELLHVPPALGAVAMALFLAGSLSRLPAVHASGLLTMSLAAASFFTAVYDYDQSISRHAQFPLYLGLFLATCAGTERMIALFQRRQRKPSPVDRAFRSVLVGLAVVAGVAGLYEWSPEGRTIFYVLGFAVLSMAVGALFRESRYRWGALALFAVVLGQAYLQFNSSLVFGASALVLLAVSWAYSRRRAAVVGAVEKDTHETPEAAPLLVPPSTGDLGEYSPEQADSDRAAENETTPILLEPRNDPAG